MLINLLLSTNIPSSFFRAFGFIKFILLAFSIKYALNYQDNKYQNLIFKCWFFIFLLTTFDLLFESYYGFDLLGFQSPMQGRLSGFLQEELKIGNYYYAFALFLTFNFFYNYKKNNMLFFLKVLLKNKKKLGLIL